MGRLLLLPSALLLSLCWSAAAIEDERAQHEAIQRRDLDTMSLLDIQQPQGVRKMNQDPGEKFWLHYWQFDEELSSSNATTAANPLALHGLTSSLFGRTLFGRDAACPSTPYNTSSCASIGYPDSCCPTTSYCYTVTDTGNGPVGCCPNGGNCGSTVGSCPSGYTSCPNSSNKGCCIPGYTCADSICVNAGTSTAIISPLTSTTTTTTSTSIAAAISVTTVTLVNVTPSAYTTTATVTVTQSETPSTDSAVVPVRPTTDSVTSTSTVTVAPAAVSSTTTTTTNTSTSSSSSSSSSGAEYCPTGYYMCSAVYLGGCCQVGRDCNTTTCPSTASTTVINGYPTVVAPADASSNAPACASGWYSCAASLGGNCCPTGYNCAQTDCPAIATGAASHDKEAPNEAAGLTLRWSFAAIALAAAIGTIFL